MVKEGLKEKEMLLKARVEAAEDELNRKQERVDEILADAQFTIPQRSKRRSEELQEALKDVKRKKRRMRIGDGVRRRMMKRRRETSCSLLKKCQSKDEKLDRDFENGGGI